jgi:hypothetical protein
MGEAAMEGSGSSWGRMMDIAGGLAVGRYPLSMQLAQ